MNRRFLITIITAALLAIIHSHIDKNGDILSALASDHSIARHVEYGFTLWNTADLVVNDAELWACVPVEETSSQRCVKITASHPYDLITDDAGNRILHFTFQQLGPFEVKIINIAVELILAKTPYQSGSGNMVSYTNSEIYCESEDEEIIKLAGRMRSRDSKETVKNIYKWVSENLKYTSYTRDIRGARYALEKREGDCTEFMYLFMALCRANKIPARGVGGFICGQDSLLGPERYHNWPEFYHSAAWHIADPQNKVFMENQENYIAMRYVGISNKAPVGVAGLFGFAGEGIKAKMN